MERSGLSLADMIALVEPATQELQQARDARLGGDLVQAEAHLTAAREYWELLGLDGGLSDCFVLLGEIRCDQDRFDEAEVALRGAIDIERTKPERGAHLAGALWALGTVYLRSERYWQARGTLAEACVHAMVEGDFDVAYTYVTTLLIAATYPCERELASAETTRIARGLLTRAGRSIAGWQDAATRFEAYRASEQGVARADEIAQLIHEAVVAGEAPGEGEGIAGS